MPSSVPGHEEIHRVHSPGLLQQAVDRRLDVLDAPRRRGQRGHDTHGVALVGEGEQLFVQ